jgi:hypothetical protein
LPKASGFALTMQAVSTLAVTGNVVDAVAA